MIVCELLYVYVMMNFVNKSLILAIFVLAGTTIGAGMFGIPYVTVRSGYLAGVIWLIVLSILVIGINYMYGQVIIRQGNSAGVQLVGLGEKYFGKPGKVIALWIILIGQWAALLAYIIGVGNLLVVLFGNNLSVESYSIIYFVIVAGITFFNLRVVSVINFWLTLAIVFIILVIAAVGIPSIQVANFTQPFSRNIVDLFFPFGVIFGALTGYAVIPEMIHIAHGGNNSNQKINFAIILGTLLPVLVYLIFQFIVVGVSGNSVTEDAIVGLAKYLPGWIVGLGAVLGILAMVTSHMALTHVIKDTFIIDYKYNKNIAWVLAITPPILVFLLGMHSFIIVLDVMGTWLGITSAVFIFALYHKSRNI